MRTKQKMELAFDDSISAASQGWGAGQAEKTARLAINARWVVFREQPDSSIFSAKGRSV